jgi:hypothetical protein
VGVRRGEGEGGRLDAVLGLRWWLCCSDRVRARGKVGVWAGRET